MSVGPNRSQEVEASAESGRSANRVPLGWVECLLGDIVRIQNGYAFPSKDFKTEGVPLIRQSNLNGSRVSLEKCVYLDPKYLELKPAFVLRKNDVLIGMSGSVGKLCIYDLDEAALQNQRTGKVVPSSTEFLSWRFVWEYLKTVEQQLLEKGKGLGVLNVSAADIESLPFRLPPLAEQRRIVGKLELLLGKVSSSQQRLSRVPGLLKRFRQSVLAAACSGKLTADWRENFPTEPCVDSDESSELPTSWRTQVLESLTDRGRPISYGVLKPGPFVENGIPLVRIVDIVRDRVDLDEMHRVSPALSSQYRRTVLRGGEVLISLVGTIGRIAWAPPILQGANVHRNIGVIASGPGVDSRYLSFSMQSESVQSQIRDATTGASQPLLNLGDVRHLLIALPPPAEQKEIVRRVEKLFAFADQIEARLKQAQTHVDRLTQSLLAKAFRGELVPTEHALATAVGRDYESASELLARIRASKTNAEPAKRKRGKTNKP